MKARSAGFVVFVAICLGLIVAGTRVVHDPARGIPRAALPAVTAAVFADDVVFDDVFSHRTMRLDYYHTGRAGQEIFALDRAVDDGPWPGSRTRLVDDTDLGVYHFQVLEQGTGRVLYSRGYASIFGEWETTDEASRMHRTFHESLRFPWPLGPVEVVVQKRDARNRFREIWRVPIDPADASVVPVQRPPVGRAWPIVDSGDPAEKVDVLVLGDGYTAAEMPRFHDDARRLVGALFDYEPFRSRRSDFNVRALDLPTPESGVNRPQAGIFRRTPIGTEYNIFGSERYILTLDNRALRDIAAAAPYEFLIILVNDDQYGGGGIFHDQATVAVGSDFADYVFVHEFGHHFAGLADEYYSSDVAYTTPGARVEPWEPNVTALLDPAALKWRHLVDAATPIPTPWSKTEFETHAEQIRTERRGLIERGAGEREFDALFARQEAWETRFLAEMEHSGKVGAFEGAAYTPTGLYRPEADCIMFTRTRNGFCAVCRAAIESVIDLYTLP